MKLTDNMCASGRHDMTLPNAVYVYRGKRSCRICRVERTKESRIRNAPKRQVPDMTPGEVYRFLEKAVQDECAMPWERHPQPMD